MSNNYGVNDLSQRFGRISISSPRNSREYDANFFPKAKKVTIYYNRSVERPIWVRDPYVVDESFTVTQIGGKEYKNIAGPILNDPQYNISISGIYKVTNRYLERQYKLKKQQKEEIFGFCEERRMYHATIRGNADSICVNNFNWRLSGQSRGHLYGFGVSFAQDSSFAHQFCRKVSKVLFVSKVLVCHIHCGSEDMILPNEGFDTTRSPTKTKSKRVFVKFEDSEFYPEYMVTYNTKNKKC